MEYTQRIWILCATLMSLNFSTAEEIATTAERNSAGLIQLIYFKNALTSKLKYKICYFGKEILFVFPRKMKTCGFLSD